MNIFHESEKEKKKSQRNRLETMNIHLFQVLYLEGLSCIRFPGTYQGCVWRANMIPVFLKEQVAACGVLFLLSFIHSSFLSFLSHLQLSTTRSSPLTSSTTRSSSSICLRFPRARLSQLLSFGSTRTAWWRALKTKLFLSASTKCCRNIQTGRPSPPVLGRDDARRNAHWQ